MAEATITIPKVRQESDVLLHVGLTDNGVAVDWTSLSDIKAYMFSDAQRIIAGKCTVEVDGTDSEVLNVSYAATRPQYLGRNSLLIRCTYMGRQKSFDVPCLVFVARTAQATGVEVLTDPELDVQLEVEDVSTSLLDSAIAAALDAAADADDAAQAAETAAAKADAAATHVPYIGENGNWYTWDPETQAFVDTGVAAGGSGASNAVQYVPQTLTTEQKAQARENVDAPSNADLNGKADKVNAAVSGNFAGLDGNGNLADSGKKASDFATAAQGTKADGAVRFDDYQEDLTDAQRRLGRRNVDAPGYISSSLLAFPAAFSTPKSYDDTAAWFGITTTQLAELMLFEVGFHVGAEHCVTLGLFDPDSVTRNLVMVMGGKVCVLSMNRSTQKFTFTVSEFGIFNNETVDNRVTSFASPANRTHTKYPTAKLVYDSIGAKYTKPSGGIPASDLEAGVIPDVTGKADKVSGGTENNFAALDANGNLKDSGHKHSDYLTGHQDISEKEDKTNKVTSLSSQSTDTQYPSAKCVYDLVGDVETLINAL